MEMITTKTEVWSRSTAPKLLPQTPNGPLVMITNGPVDQRICLVGDTGIEPVTPTVSRLSDQASDLRLLASVPGRDASLRSVPLRCVALNRILISRISPFDHRVRPAGPAHAARWRNGNQPWVVPATGICRDRVPAVEVQLDWLALIAPSARPRSVRAGGDDVQELLRVDSVKRCITRRSRGLRSGKHPRQGAGGRPAWNYRPRSMVDLDRRRSMMRPPVGD